MFKVIKKIRREELPNLELRNWLRDFYYVASKLSVDAGVQSLISVYRQLVRDKIPKSPEKSFFFLRRVTSEFPDHDHIWEYWLQVIWPLFFEKFPKGEIWIVRIHEDWFNKIWQSERRIIHGTEVQDSLKVLWPHEGSGLSADLFPLIALSLLCFSIYPLILCDYVYISKSVVIYIPDRIIKYNYSYELEVIYFEVLFKFIHIYNDQWTFDGRPTPKSFAPAQNFEPLKQSSYFEEIIKMIEQRMKDIISISDPWEREILGMTVNRTICDAIICNIAFLPYVSKIFFFNTLEKLANIMKSLNIFENLRSEVEIWKQLLEPDFLEKKVLNVIKQLPGHAGEYLAGIVEFVIDEIKINKLTSDFFRFIRNTHHGYFLNNKNLKKFLASSAEFNNDITLLSIPLVIYLLSLRWRK